ncbi:MAG: Endolytic peptidoglycan transglycosylase RlpA [Hyphomicrobiales bacterium]|nr:Endolytic peptidoglycan transglycosylase RlpA [Hyphomicrobiales bacterium]
MIASHIAPVARFSTPRALCAAAVCAIALAGCAQAPKQSAPRSKEYFPESKYGPASQRVVRDGEVVPRGGGQYLVGRPYTIAGRRYTPQEVDTRHSQVGGASWYGDAFHGRRTANGEIYDMRSLTAAHPTMPLPSYVRVTNMRNGRSMIVRVNDRGPYHPGRVLDVSRRVAEALDFRHLGTANVKVDYVGKAGLAGSDDDRLMATLRTDGRPATLDGSPEPAQTMIAQAPVQAPAQAPEAPAQAPVARTFEPAPRARAETNVQAQAPVEPVRMASLPAYAPMPPVRPFDLATIPGADVPIMAPRRVASHRAAFFAPPSVVAATLIKRQPFAAVDMRDVKPLR